MGLTDDENPIEERFGSTAISTNGNGSGSGNQIDALKTDELISMVSHDLRSPLSSIQLNIQSILHSRRALPQWVRVRLLRAEELVQHMAQLINDILIVERGSHLPSPRSDEKIDLLAFVRQIVSLLNEQIEAAKSSVCIRCDGAIVGQWDRVYLAQIVSNLVTNAIKYGAGKPFEIALDRGEDGARIAISDHGIGLAERDHQRIFERFAQLEPTSGQHGVGLGLWIVSEAAHRLHGTVRIRSVPGEGSTFIVELPYRG